MNSWAPGIGTSSCTSTPSMSVSQVSTGRVVLAAILTQRRSAPGQQHLDAVGGVRTGHPPAPRLDPGRDLRDPVVPITALVALPAQVFAVDVDQHVAAVLPVVHDVPRTRTTAA